MFDSRRYKDQILIPLNKNKAQQRAVEQAARSVPDARDEASVMAALKDVDPLALFGLSPDMSDAQVAATLTSLEALLNKGRPPVATTIKQLLVAVKKQIPDTYQKSGFWRKLAEVAGDVGQQRMRDFYAAVQQDCVLGVIPYETLRKAAKGHGIPDTTPDSTLERGLRDVGVRVVAEVRVPQVALPHVLRNLHSSFASPIDVLLLHHPGASTHAIRVIDELSIESAGGRMIISMTDVRESKKFADQRADDATESAKKVLNAIAECCQTNDDLHELILVWFLNLASQLVDKDGLLLPMAMGELCRIRGLDKIDAARLLMASSGPTVRGPDVDEVRRQVGSGELQSARRTFASLQGMKLDGEAGAALASAAQALEAAERRKQESVVAYQSAMSERNYQVARMRLVEARSIDQEDETLDRLLREMPPSPPSQVSATYVPDMREVRISWNGEEDSDVRYVVLRSDIGPPANPKAGQAIGSASTEQVAVDSQPMFARHVTYAVFAVKDSGSYAVAHDSLTILPPPTEVIVGVTTSGASMQWQVPEEAHSVVAELVDPKGNREVIPDCGRTQCTLSGLQLGQKYQLRLSAHYVLLDGQRATSPPALVDFTPRGTIRPVNDLKISSRQPSDMPALLRAEWTEIPGFHVDLWSVPVGSKAPRGPGITVQALNNQRAERINGLMCATGSTQSLEFDEPEGIHNILPITWDGPKGVAGQAVPCGSAAPPDSVRVQRLGRELLVSWHWPEGPRFVELSWIDRGGTKGRERVDKAGYHMQGGARIADAASVTQVSVATVVEVSGSECLSPPVTVEASPLAPTLSYRLTFKGGLASKRRIEIVVASDDFRALADLLVVLREGSFMPMKPSDGEVISQISCDLSNSSRVKLQVPLPRVKSPFWIRIFPARESEVLLMDPPTSEMKG